MSIDRVGQGGPIGIVPDNTKSKDKEKHLQRAEAKDAAVLSSEALQHFAAERTKRLEEIRQRVHSGFYETREVTEKVVEKLIRDLKRPPTA